MNHSALLQGSNTQLVNQLVFFDEEKQSFLKKYIPDDAKERNKVDQVLNMYTASLENIIAESSRESLNSKVLIGSQVTLRYLDDGYEEQYSIVFPHMTDPSKNWISFLSPIGLQLLMTTMGEVCEFIVPSGSIEVTITEIKYMNSGEINKY
ncbi:GreA/GreB family elongation factor [Paenibacillus glacialis]|uniref:Transcription elongation factor GreA/GreB C-terminal domain-containing protein n=1 Tax=Paenibacillus glacialis TaxID=494026 RepID=A0A168PES4_9BACL|nr:GreA/GreB family elongation factor [Paenibacillus glacialis]OAB46692.1 hypothetical protein PGLA_00245 [Paenibacillus glacialis]